jgi:peroxiredoxin/uncharacterized membrane protein YphA (DoxX/SURF4 family)
MSVILLLARLLLATVFAVAGIAKLLDRAGSRKSAGDFGVPAFLAKPLAFVLPLVELACAVALLRGGWAWFGASGALAMLSVFMAAIAVNLARGRAPDCHCFGQLHSSPVGWTTLGRNAVLAGLAALIVWQGAGHAGADLGEWLQNSSRPEIAVLGLAITVAALTAFVLLMLVQLLRQNGRLLLRLEAIEAKLGATAAPPPQGLPVGSVAPGFSLAGLDGETMTLDMLRERGTPLLLFFTEPGCGACDGALPEVARWQREHAGRLSVVPITRGDVHVNRAKRRAHNLQDVLLQTDREVSQAYRAEATPSAVVIKEGLIHNPVAVGIDAIRALVVGATLPPPLKKGDRVPSLKLRDLNGGAMDFAMLRGRRTLLLFWNPSCGFCHAMLGDVKEWERNRPNDAPELLVISTGSPAANRAQGFRSRVLLDPKSGANQIFGAWGTPSALIVDEDGRVASEVGAGASAVFALAGAVLAGSAT